MNHQLAQDSAGMRREEKQRLTKGRVLGTNTDHKHVEGNLGVRDITLDFGIVTDVDNALLVVDLGSFGFVESHAGLLVAQNVADGLHDRAVLDQTGGT